MQKSFHQGRISRQLLPGLVLVAMLTSCTFVGPRTISSGRLAYNEAISETDNQQMLMVLVHNRYEERGHLLNVASVTANVSIQASAGLQAGFGQDSDYEGNLVPFSGGFIYEENPTISYVPVAGERYLSQLTTPLPITMLAQITRTITNPAPVFDALVTAVNGIYNPDFMFTSEDNDPRFDQFTGIMTELTRAHRLNWVESPEQKGQFSLVIDQSVPLHAASVKELLRLLSLPPGDYQTPMVVIPVALAVDGASSGIMGITTRSVWDMVEILTAAIEVPSADEQNGVVMPPPPPGRVGKDLRINYSADQPEHAYVKVQHRNGWFSIDERDLDTKQYFKLLGSLWSLAMANAVGLGPAAPVLTVPVSR